MAFKGTIYVHNTGTKLRVLAENRGASPGVFSHNILPNRAAALNPAGAWQHDDMRYGHSNVLPAGTDEKPGTFQYEFTVGEHYAGTPGAPIKPGSWLRVGMRARSWQAVEIPPAGETVVIPYEEMKPQQYNYGWEAVPYDRSERASAPSRALEAMYDLINIEELPRIIRGEASIKPVRDEARPNVFLGWELRFVNRAPKALKEGQTGGFTGTAVLLNNAGTGEKNAGRAGGLESMALPGGGYEAVQFIRYGGDYGVEKYGVRAVPGTRVRLGIRGHGTFETQLPAIDDEVVVPVFDFKKEASQVTSDYFEERPLLEKLGEKKNRLEIYRDGKRINDELPDTIYEGELAYDKAEFKDPPLVQAQWVNPNDELPKGGWRIEMLNRLPEKDGHGPVGFRGTVFFEGTRLPAFAFTPTERKHSWVLPWEDRPADGAVIIDTHGLGWRGRLMLPSDAEVTAQTEADSWILRETDYFRGDLYPLDEKPQVPAPRLIVRGVEPSEKHPEGGWRIEIENTFPEQDSEGKLGFVATLKLGENGTIDGRTWPPKKLSAPGETKAWFIGVGKNVGETPAAAGEVLQVGTRGAGWYARVQLPELGQTLDTAEMGENPWRYRADQFNRAHLMPQFTNQAKH